ncbi:MAG TPA: VWA domain-containing protein [Kofleriaceae bacterium]|nr:VWA domain-containing protein [Kofleriaceae bacterium]
MFGVSFVTPALAVIAFVVPAFVFVMHIYDHWRRGTLTRRLGELPVLGKVIGSASHGRRIIKDTLVTLGLSGILFSAARPQIEGKRKVELRGLDVVLAVDVSKSMLVDDVGPTVEMQQKKIEPSRLARARELAKALIEELPGDRIGPVVFAGAAAHFPLTEDHQVASRFLGDLGPNDLPPGSNLAEVFRVARCMLRPDLYEDLGCARIGRRGHGGDPLRGESLDPTPDKPDEEKLEQEVERGKAIVILTDGGEADAATVREVATARELGIAVFVVGIGSDKGGIVYEVDPFSGKRTTTPKKTPEGETVVSKRDDAGMKAIAAAGGDENRYLMTNERGEVNPMPIVEALRGVNRGLATKQVKEKRDIYQPFLFGAFALLLIEVAIGTRRRQRYPEAR